MTRVLKSKLLGGGPVTAAVPQLRTCTATPMDDWEDRYVGHWTDGVGTEIKIVKLRKHKFLVSYFREGQLVQRPWMGDQPSIDMPATYIVDPLEATNSRSSFPKAIQDTRLICTTNNAIGFDLTMVRSFLPPCRDRPTTTKDCSMRVASTSCVTNTYVAYN